LTILVPMTTKKVILYSLLVFTCVLVAFHFVFFTVYLNLGKTTARTNALSLVNENMKILTFKKSDLYKNKNGLEWKDANKELVVNGVYYEVIKLVSMDELITAYLVKDIKETNLVKRYFNLANRHSKNLVDTGNFLLSLKYLQTSSQVVVTNDYSYLIKMEFNPVFSTLDFKKELIKPPIEITQDKILVSLS
jgi:hypothetical protein